MLFTPDRIRSLVLEHFALDVSVHALPGELDLNFFVQSTSGKAYTFKIANPAERRENLEFQHSVIQHLTEAGFDLEIPAIIPSVKGGNITEIIAADGSKRFIRLLAWVEGRCLAEVNPHSPLLLERVGEMCGKLCAALAGFDHPAAHRFLKWDPSQAAWTREHLPKIAGKEKRELAAYFLQLFEEQAIPLFPALRKSVNYNDANDYNILVNHDPENPGVPGVIDFGDATYTHTVNDLAIAAAYAAMHKPDPLAAIFHLTRGFHRIFPLTGQEAEALFPLIGARLLISVTCSAINLSDNPGNAYLQISDRPAWDLLEKLRAIPPALAHATVRHACGWEPCPTRAQFETWVHQNRETIHRIVPADLDQ
ncbi:MAG: phosphotransferase, partial [Lewinellaceae bacterium]|nr:phosphotransferase [Lewinellaceae bacterium]